MYYYIYDSFLSDKKYRRTLEQIETRICDLGIKGNIERLTPVRDISVIVQNGLDAGYENFIIVGNDYTVTNALNTLMGHNITLGVIPVGEPTHIGRILGMPKEADACLAISKRLHADIDVGTINDKYFLTSVEVGFESDEKEGRKDARAGRRRSLNYFSVSRAYKPKDILVEIDGRMEIEAEIFNLSIINIKDTTYAAQKISPTDGLLNISLVPSINKKDIFRNMKYIKGEEYENLPNTSIFRGKEVIIKGKKELLVNADGKPFGKAPIKVGVADRKLRVIVGKDRRF